jgi:two-component sensor histidine kinase
VFVEQTAALLEALHEPSLVVGRDGIVKCANRPAKQHMGIMVVEQPLSNLVVNPDAAHLFLDRCFGSGQPLIGSLMLRTPGSPRKFNCRGSVFPAGGGRYVLLRLSNSGGQSFAALTRTVAELKVELKKRQRSEAILKETVHERELLFRELEHRVKNNMQMLAAMLHGAEREATSPEAKGALKDASMRFSAVRAVQQLLYRSETLTSISAEALVSTLIRAAETLAENGVETNVAVDPMQLPIETAVPIGLVMNELLTNAVKYGCPVEGAQTLRVSFTRKADQLEFVVEDNGPGFELSHARKRASGIGLVLGLLRQLGASIRVEREDGARCIVSFPDAGRGSVRTSA